MINPNGIIATIDLKAVTENYLLACERAQQSQVIPVIKANAYGHGALEVATQLSSLEESVVPQRFAVARYSEAQQLRDSNIKQTLVIMSDALSLQQMELCIAQNYEPVIYDLTSVQVLIDYFKTSNADDALNKTADADSVPTACEKNGLTVWLKVDTGMHRLGLSCEDFKNAYRDLNNCAAIGRIIVMSHFATADARTDNFLEQQFIDFKTLKKFCIQAPSSLANSAAILRNKKYHGDFVRPGIMLYGADPLFTNKELKTNLACSMQLTAPVIALRDIKMGESVGYNRSWHAGRDSKIATIGIGYADGYPRHAKNGTPVYINGQIAPLVGTVSMDMITVDVTDLDNIQLGDRVELWGKNINVNSVAIAANSISYVLFTGLGGRTQKVYDSLQNLKV